ncbi:hypothetical protein [Streptomyces sp. NPDC050759]|uniref:hypothetical protein n=1 Tax=Streptomyces sp. NPDC050759 TaxID=3365635 RepID=UPI0037A0B923
MSTTSNVRTFPQTALALAPAAAAAQPGHPGTATELSEGLEPLWALFRRHGSLRVMSAAASHFALTGEPNLARPLRALDETARHEVIAVLASLQLTS